MTIRFSDNVLNDIEGSDFVIRHRVPRLVQVIIIFLAAFDLICFSAYIANDSSITIGFLLILLVSLAALGALTFYFLNRFRKLILATEFQTAMLASAAQIGTRFCFIVNRDGMIYYVDPGFQKFFSSFIDSGNRTLKSLLAFTEVPEPLSAKVYATLKQGKSDHVILSFKAASGQPITIMTTIDVIVRPKGYFIIRGRDYVEKRAEEKTINIEDDKMLAMLLDQTLAGMAGGILVAASNGRVVHVNRELEEWLGYAPGEVVQARIRTGQIFYQYVGHEIGVFLLNNFEGEVLIQRKNKQMVATKVTQRLLSVNNQSFGISAIVDISP